MSGEPNPFMDEDDGHEPIPPGELIPSVTPRRWTKPVDPLEERERMTELGNARRIVRLFGDRLRYSGAYGWMVWDEKRWKTDDTEEASRLVSKALTSLYDELPSIHDADEHKKAAAWAFRCQASRTHLNSMAMTKFQPEISVRGSDFDTDPWAMNVENGTIDLRTGRLRPHNPADNLTKLAPVVYEPAAHSPLWESFLERFLPDVGSRGFLKRYLGSCLTGDASDQALVILYGPGGNGKSTAMETVQRILGDYFVGTPFSTLTVDRSKGKSATNDLAALSSARLVVASEPPEGVALETSTVKALTGGDTITCRFLYKEQFSYIPQFKVALVTNHRPQITEATHAIWRRVHLVPFSVKITEAERDETFKDRLWEERAGILRWLVDGCLEWQTEGLNPPPSVRSATEEYRREEDSFGAFLDERCDQNVNAVTKAAAILTAFNKWAKDNGLPLLNVKSLAGRLREKGLTNFKSDGIACWRGLIIRPTQEDGQQG